MRANDWLLLAGRPRVLGARHPPVAPQDNLALNELAAAVAMQETGRLTNSPGIGTKTSERLLLERKDKFEVDPRVAIGGGGSTAVA